MVNAGSFVLGEYVLVTGDNCDRGSNVRGSNILQPSIDGAWFISANRYN